MYGGNWDFRFEMKETIRNDREGYAFLWNRNTFSLLISNFYYFWAVLCTRGLPYSLICIAGLDLTGTWLRDTTIAE